MGWYWKGGGRSLGTGGPRRGRSTWVGGAEGTLTRDVEEASSGAHVVGDAALIAAAAVTGQGVEAQVGMVGGLGGCGDDRWLRQQLPFEAPHGRGDALGVTSQQGAAQEHRTAQRLAHVLGAGLHLGRDWGARTDGQLGGGGRRAALKGREGEATPRPA